MDYYDVLRRASDEVGISLRSVAQAIGRTPAYVSGAIARGSDPSTSRAAAMLDVCGYALVAVPRDDVPPSALVIDSPSSKE